MRATPHGETLLALRMNVDVPEYAVHDEVRVDPARTALVVIDMQNDFVKPGGGLLVPDAESTVPVVRRRWISRRPLVCTSSTARTPTVAATLNTRAVAVLHRR